ncbi:MAG: EFR1 family ferrodoxin [bacterium]|nr:EFR1 family ferrodoxin [bacterium]
MIYYFSGTGNSKYVAKKIASALNLDCQDIPTLKDCNDVVVQANPQKRIGFVFPIHAWAPPKFVLDFISQLDFSQVIDHEFFYISTCGAEEGNTYGVMKKALQKKGIKLQNGYCVVMPNNYNIGYELDSPEEVLAIYEAAEHQIRNIIVAISMRSTKHDVVFAGKHPRLKSGFINTMFRRFAFNTSPFYATDACIQCGLCAKVCPVHTITCNPTPVWSKECTQCLACINSCPVQAIEYGNKTQGRRRYLHQSIHQTYDK